MSGNDSSASITQPGGPFVALRFRDFRLFWIGYFISHIGDSMQQTAVSWLLYDMTKSPLQLGLNGAFRAVPMIALGLFGGTLADRFDRRRVLLVTQSVLMVLAFVLGILDHSGHIAVWHIYGLTLVTAVVRSVDAPARQALVPSLVPRFALPNAIALNSLLWKGTILLGPALAGIAISTVGTDGAFFANALSFVAVVIALVLMRSSAPARPASRGFLRDLRHGLTYVLTQRMILGIMVMEAFSSLFGLDPAMLTIFAQDILRAGATGLGFLQSARGLGAVVGSGILVGVLSARAQGKVLIGAAVIYGLAFALFGLSNNLVLSLLLIFITGAADTIWGATRSTILQINTPEHLQGRVMGVFSLSSRGLSPLGQVETGLVVPLIGARQATFFGGALVLLASLLTVWRVPSLYRFHSRAETAPDIRDVKREH
ncbi:MAG TPA: MFS transporter [Candidatus Acidoferrales bacterium]|nr:MFS transporter [Candidatus Acidoferrales bacterium]